MRALALVAALAACGCSAQPYVMASPAECAAAGWPVNVWHGNVSLRCPVNPMQTGAPEPFARRRADAGAPDGR